MKGTLRRTSREPVLSSNGRWSADFDGPPSWTRLQGTDYAGLRGSPSLQCRRLEFVRRIASPASGRTCSGIASSVLPGARRSVPKRCVVLRLRLGHSGKLLIPEAAAAPASIFQGDPSLLFWGTPKLAGPYSGAFILVPRGPFWCEFR